MERHNWRIVGIKLGLMVAHLLMATLLKGQPITDMVSPFNGLSLSDSIPNQPWRFLVGGHLYGAHDNMGSIFPSASFCGSISKLNATASVALFTTGDLIRDGSQRMQRRALVQCLEDLNMPVFNAPGNHDLKGNGQFRNTMAPSGQALVFQECLFVLMDSEPWARGHADSVVAFLKQVETQLKDQQATYRQVFVLSHRLVWSSFAPEFHGADALCNDPLLDRIPVESGTEILKSMEQITGDRPLFWFSGDVGAKWSIPALYMQGPKGWHFYANGIGDCADDAFLLVTVNPLGITQVELLPLGDTTLAPISTYDLEWGQQRLKKQAVTPRNPSWLNSSFLVGMALGLLSCLGFFLMLRLFRRRIPK
jgi:hypothetical protein